ncbi:hypothetical protein Btru_076353 [Bulinus truncatus]|nr:hypothetical protein Btru_076353 [Bulinus truncatus]
MSTEAGCDMDSVVYMSAEAEKQEARIQVIAQDLDQATFVADALQSMLEAREKLLSEEFNNAGITNQMISAQEEELVKLYDILEKQKDEIENLNQMLDHLAQQGPDGVGVGFDDELWRIRQEVNSLKETLAMQSAYVQAMPDISNIGIQTNTHINGTVAGTHARSQPNIDIPWNPHDQMQSKFSGSQAASVASTHQSSVKPFSGATTYSSRSNGTSKPQPTLIGGASISSAPLPESSARDAGVRKYVIEHLGTERKESKNPSVTKSALNRQTTQSAINHPSVPKSVEWVGQPFSPASSLKHFQSIHQRDKRQQHTDISGFQPAQNYEQQNVLQNYATRPISAQTFIGNSVGALPAQHLTSNEELLSQKQYSAPMYPAQGSFKTSNGVQIHHTQPQTALQQHADQATASRSGNSIQIRQQHPDQATASISGNSIQIRQQHPYQATTCRSGYSIHIRQHHSDQATACRSGNSIQIRQQHADQATTCRSGYSIHIRQHHSDQATACRSGNSIQIRQQHADQATTCRSGYSIHIRQQHPDQATASRSGNNMQIRLQHPYQATASRSGYSIHIRQQHADQATASISGNNIQIRQQHPYQATTSRSGYDIHIKQKHPHQATASRSGNGIHIRLQHAYQATASRSGNIIQIRLQHLDQATACDRQQHADQATASRSGNSIYIK